MALRENIDAALGSVLLRSLPEDVRDDILKDASVHRYGRGETLFLQGEISRSIHVVLDGWVKLYRVGPSGNEAVVEVFPRGHSFGEAVALRGDAYPVSAEAVTDCKVLQISARSLVSTMRREPEVMLSMMASAFQHLHELVSQVEQIKAQTGAQRVAEFLLGLCDATTGQCVVTLPYDKVLIAGRLGMKPESLSRAFNKLKSVGVRVGRNHASIDNIEALRSYAEEDRAAAWSKSL